MSRPTLTRALAEEPSEWPARRVQRLLRLLRLRGVAGRWQPGTYAAPGPTPPGSQARQNFVWGPDGIVLAVSYPDARRAMGLMHESGIRRPMVVQQVQNTDQQSWREVVRMELSDFLDLLDSHAKVLAQEGRLDNE